MASNDPSPNPTDAALASSARQGDRAAFVEIVARHQALVCGTAYGILNDFAASEDAGQEAFLNAWRKIGDLKEPEKLRPWLATIARNVALGKLRGRKDAQPLDAIGDAVDDAPLPDEITANDEEAALVREHLASLPEKYRTPLVLFYREGQSVRAVAEALELSEDAVKQRLARGRAKLRDRVVGLIESTLERTTPTAVFTMAVATAVGALKAPAAVAATAFAASAPATAAATTTTAANTTTPILTAMTASNVPYLTAAIVAAVCVPIGFTAHMGFESDSPEKGRSKESHALPDLHPRDPNEVWPDSALLAEWKRLHDTHGTGPDAMPLLFDSIQQIPEAFRRRAFRAALVAEWAQLDPEGAFAFFGDEKNNYAHRWQVFDEWLKQNPDATVDALMAEPSGWKGLARTQLKNIARTRPDRLAALVAKMPEPTSYWRRDVADAFEIAAAAGLDKARTAAEGLSGKNGERALSGIAKYWAVQDSDAALEWARGFPEGAMRDEIIRHVLFGLARTSTATALDNVGLVPPGGSPQYFASTTGARLLQEAIKTDFEGTLAWLTANPNQLDRSDITGIAEEVTSRLNRDPAGFLDARLADGSLGRIMPAINSALLNDSSGRASEIWSWLETQGDSEALGNLRSQVISCSANHDPETALQLAATLGDGPDEASLREEAARAVLAWGRRSNQLDHWLEVAPEHMHEPLIEGAFHWIRNMGRLENPLRWAERLDQLDDDVRSEATTNFSSVWAGTDPDAAADWALNLPPGPYREVGLRSVAVGWSQSDPANASEWISALPAGADRDVGAAALAQNIVAEMPNEAWEWATSISDSDARAEVLEQVVGRIVNGPHRDSLDLSSWINATDMTDELRTRLLSFRAPNDPSSTRSEIVPMATESPLE